MRIKAKISRQDIDQGEYNTANCPESYALRRALTEADVDYVYAFVRQRGKSLTANIIRAIEVPDTDHVDLVTDTVYLMRYKCNSHLPNWSANFNKCIESSRWGFVYYYNTNYDKNSRREDVPETYFEFNLPKSLKIGKHLSHKVRPCFKEYFFDGSMCTGLPKHLYNITGRLFIHNLYDKYLENEDVFIEKLTRGELARRDYSAYDHIEIINRQRETQKIDFKPEIKYREVLVPTNGYPTVGANCIDNVIDRLLEIYSEYEDLLIHVLIRHCYFDELEAGISILHTERKIEPCLT